MARIFRRPAAWFTTLFCWCAVLWFLSSVHGPPLGPEPFPQFDKLEHFGYFLIGGFLLTGGISMRNPEQTSWKKTLGTAILVMAAIGFIDEWHQCFTPGRSGADPWDWLADLAGAAAGAFIFKAVRQRFH